MNRATFIVLKIVLLTGCVSSRDAGKANEAVTERKKEARENIDESFEDAGNEAGQFAGKIEKEFKKLAEDLMESIDDFRTETIGLALVSGTEHQALQTEIKKVKNLTIKAVMSNLKDENRQKVWFLKTAGIADDLVENDKKGGFSETETATRKLIQRWDAIEARLDFLRKKAGLDK